MPLPISKVILAKQFNDAIQLAIRLQAQITDLKNASAVGNTNRQTYFQLLILLRRAVEVWNDAKAIPGMAQYAKDQFDDQNLDVGTEFTAMVSAADALATWIFNTLPTDGGTGGAIERVVASDGTVSNLTFTPGQTAVFRTAADVFLATMS